MAPPPAVPHTIAPPAGKPAAGTQFVLRCQEGFAPVGDMTLQCLNNQQWATVKGHCKSKTFPIISRFEKATFNWRPFDFAQEYTAVIQSPKERLPWSLSAERQRPEVVGSTISGIGSLLAASTVNAIFYGDYLNQTYLGSRHNSRLPCRSPSEG